MPEIRPDAETRLVREHPAVVYTPRRARKRFPENCVQLFATEQEAVAAADPARDLHAARVLGPSRSSEGFRLYYLVRWLDE
jgi:hypothetical protein